MVEVEGAVGYPGGRNVATVGAAGYGQAMRAFPLRVLALVWALAFVALPGGVAVLDAYAERASAGWHSAHVEEQRAGSCRAVHDAGCGVCALVGGAVGHPGERRVPSASPEAVRLLALPVPPRAGPGRPVRPDSPRAPPVA